MKVTRLLLSLLLVATVLSASAAEPLRVFIRGGVKTHGPNQHDHPRFLNEWKKLLADRGMQSDGSMDFPTADQLAKADVLIIYAADGMKIEGAQRAYFERFLQRGGGLVVIHDGVVSGQGAENPEWTKEIIGGAWHWDGPEAKHAKWYEGEVGIYFVAPNDPIVKGVSNFDWQDEIYYNLDMSPDVNVLATSFESVFTIAPQIWTYEKTRPGGSEPYRAFVSIPGHEYDVFNTPHYRAILMRGIAWAGKRSDINEFCQPAELASLKYPAGGPTPPEKEAAKLHVHPGFDISLVASEPLVEKVISLDWDPAGRMWVAETPEYPGGRTINMNDRPIARQNHNPLADYGTVKFDDRPALDRVSWLEDTDGDGRMDKKHIFADKDHGVPGGIERVTSLVPYRDGVIITAAPDIMWLRDTNGDGVCDKMEKLYTGFGNFDTHAVINNMRWGLDGWIYSAIGYSAGEPKSVVTGEDFGRVTAGVIRFKPDGSKVQQVVSGSCNTWGFDFAPDGEMFYTTATCGEHFLHIVMPDYVLARGNVGRVRGSHVAPDHQKIAPLIKHTRQAYVQIDWVGMFTAAAGCCIYNGGAWPEQFNGSHFVSETTMSLVHNEFLKPTGVTYVASKEKGREDTEFINGTDLWFRPIHTRVGPDGALYVVDFYNQAAIHNDTRGPAHGANNAATRPDRDHHFARIWRVQYKDPKKIVRPDLTTGKRSNWVKALENENGWTRDTGARLLRENGAGEQLPELRKLAFGSEFKGPTRIAALFTLSALDQLDGGDLLAAISDKDPVVRKNALRIAADRDNRDYTPDPEGLRNALNDPDGRAKLWALIALQTTAQSPETAAVLVDVWPKLDEPHLQSAAVGVAGNDPLLFIKAAFEAKDPAFLADFVSHTTRLLANRGNAGDASKLVELIAQQPAATDGLKQIALESLAANLKPAVVPDWNSALGDAFKAVLASNRPGLPGAALPLIARWDKDKAMANDLKPVIAKLNAGLADTTMGDEQRGQVAINLLGVRQMDSSIVPAVASLLGGSSSVDLQKRIVGALGATGDAAAGTELVAAYTRVPAPLREDVFGTVVRRTEWARELLQALADKKIDLITLGPANQYRLRNHSDRDVAAQANRILDSLKGPEQKEKDAIIAKWRPEVAKAGDPKHGKELFLANCAVCHKFKNDGADFAPNLTGMGAHGPEELLVHIIDPNKLVEPNFVAVSVETKDDNSYDGIVLRENASTLVLRNQTAEYEIDKSNIASRRSTGRSLMPEGFEALGAEGLRDLLSYICEDEQRFRILDLTAKFDGASNAGLYTGHELRGGTVLLKKFGAIKVGDVPFDIISPEKSLTGKNLLVLKSTSGICDEYPQSVDVNVGFEANRLHFLGGIGGWAYPWDAERNKDKPAAKVIVHYRDGDSEELIFTNGVEFADHIGSGSNYEVPGSEFVPDLVRSGQVRYFSKDLKKSGIIDHLTIASFNNAIAPTFVGITVEKASQPARKLNTVAAKAAPAGPKRTTEWGSGIKVLLIGGGSSHDYEKWFNEYDRKVIDDTGRYTARYFEPQELTADLVESADIIVQSANKAFPDHAVRDALFAHVNAGKGLILLHPGLWYNWRNWPEYNRELAGGGAHAHTHYSDFEVKVLKPEHPVMKGVPADFGITDELYWYQHDPNGTPIEVLAEAYAAEKKQTYPQVFVVEYPKARIVGITLGHDGKAHELPAFQRVLINALDWVHEGK